MVLSVGGDGVFPPSLQYTRGGQRTRTAMRHTGWPPMVDGEEPSGPENPTPPPSHRKVRVARKGGNGANFGVGVCHYAIALNVTQLRVAP